MTVSASAPVSCEVPSVTPMQTLLTCTSPCLVGWPILTKDVFSSDPLIPNNILGDPTFPPPVPRHPQGSQHQS